MDRNKGGGGVSRADDSRARQGPGKRRARCGWGMLPKLFKKYIYVYRDRYEYDGAAAPRPLAASKG
jgi:hypothetical protein